MSAEYVNGMEVDAEDACGKWSEVKCKESKREVNISRICSLAKDFISFSPLGP